MDSTSPSTGSISYVVVRPSPSLFSVSLLKLGSYA